MPAETLLLQLHYSGELQSAFARLSGDYNPIHVDPVAARRTLVGAQVVHGVHHLLAGMEGLLKHLADQNHPAQGLSGFSAQFLKPVRLGDTVEIYLLEKVSDEFRLGVKSGGEIMCQLSFRAGGAAPSTKERLIAIPRELPRELSFAEAEGLQGTLPLGLDAQLARQLFPGVLDAVGTTGLAEILALTRVVGMHCPGLHSLFSAVSARWDGCGTAGVLAYKVEQTDDRFSRVVLGVTGPRIKGHLTAFFRPAPEPQPGIEDVAKLIGPQEFLGSVALVIGGSRGLGEITAKMIAAGGGLPVLTYHQGATDAERLANEIREWGGRCESLQFDALQGKQALQGIFAREPPPTTIYYFATPKIFAPRRGFFDLDILALHNAYYVTAFGNLLEAIPGGAKSRRRVFYPSSVAVTENLREIAEYAIAKRAGEDLCAFYNRYSKNIELIVERLPRIHTDQTRTLLPVPAENALDVMLPIVRKMEAGWSSRDHL